MKDVLIGIGFFIAGLATIVTAQQFPTLPSLRYGPSLFPSLVGGGFCLGGIVLALSNVRSALSTGRTFVADQRQAKNVWVSLLPPALIVFYIVSSDHVGAPLAMATIMFLLMMIRKTKPYVALLTSITASLIIYFIFSRYLLVPLPQGALLGGGMPWMR